VSTVFGLCGNILLGKEGHFKFHFPSQPRIVQ
jgi:hypothetical protein